MTSRPSPDLIIAAYQHVTQEWWDTQSQKFDLFISQLVVQEVSAGDEQAVKRRLQITKGIPLLVLNNNTMDLAKKLVDKKAIPKRAVNDALHIAVATTNAIDYLLTWNFKHSANVTMRQKIEPNLP